MSSSNHLLGKSVDAEMIDESCRFKVLSSSIKAREWVWFPTFTTGEHLWRISCGPRISPQEGQFCGLTFYLNYGGEWKDVKVTFELGLLKKDETLSLVKCKTTSHTFSKCGEYVRMENVVQGKELKRFLEDDYFIVICNIKILSATCMGPSDSVVTILSSLIGTSKSHFVEEDGQQRKMPNSFFHFKVVCDCKSFGFPSFIVGGHFWYIGCYYNKKERYLSFNFSVQSATKELKASLEFGVLKKDEGTYPAKWKTVVHTFKRCGEPYYMDKFIEGDELKQYLQDDYFRAICIITILSETITLDHDVTILGSIGKPRNHPINGTCLSLHGHISKLLQNEERADVIFEINGEIFHAHKLILAARSSVFNEIFKPYNEFFMKKIEVNDIEPRVFKAMLHFIYTDVLPDLNGSDYCGSEKSSQMALIEMFQHLLAAADYYALDKLKLLCEEALCRMITIDNVATTLGYAEKHKCADLKARCIEFATSPQNFMSVALTGAYASLIVNHPTIIEDLRAKFNIIST